jgi:DNA-binding transcriptional regulator YiaG
VNSKGESTDFDQSLPHHEVAALMEAVRAEYGMTRRTIAAALGVPADRVQDWEGKGKRKSRMPASTLQALYSHLRTATGDQRPALTLRMASTVK